MVALGQHERKMIGTRVREALRQAKLRGVKFLDDLNSIRSNAGRIRTNHRSWSEPIDETAEVKNSRLS